MKLLFSIFSFFLFQLAGAQEYYIVLGTYDSPKSEGVYVYKFNAADGSAREIVTLKHPILPLLLFRQMKDLCMQSMKQPRKEARVERL